MAKKYIGSDAIAVDHNNLGNFMNQLSVCENEFQKPEGHTSVIISGISVSKNTYSLVMNTLEIKYHELSEKLIKPDATETNPTTENNEDGN